MTPTQGVIIRAVAAITLSVAVAAGGAAPAWSAAARSAAARSAAARSAAAPSAGSWGQAIQVPGLEPLNSGGTPGVLVSCPSAGNCAASGDYTADGAPRRGFVADERNGVWGKAIEVPGLRFLGGYANVASVSCASAGNCAIGGSYSAPNGYQGFVAAELNGRWGKAIEVPGLAALNKIDAYVSSVSCASAGNCTAGGGYFDGQSNQQGFVVSRRNGQWGKAIEVPGLGVLNRGGDAELHSVSCGLAGNCVAGGYYRDRQGHGQGFVAVERSGVWGRAIEVPGLGALNTRGFAEVLSVSCALAGNCAVGGDYRDSHGHVQGFVAVERNGVWGKAIEVPGLGAMNTRGFADVNSVSCASAGNCAAGGDYDGRHLRQGFVAIERDGVWGRAIEVPGLATLNTGGNGFVLSVSCSSPGNCAAGGGYSDRRGQQGFVVSEQHGRWDSAIEVPGLRALNVSGSAAVFAVSCPPAGNCTAGGSYSDRRDDDRGFVVSQTGLFGKPAAPGGLTPGAAG